MEQKKDGRRGNNQSASQRRVSIYKRRREKPTKATRNRLEIAKNVLRRHYSDVFDATLCDPRFEGLIYVGERKYREEEVLDMAATILAKEETRNMELRSQYHLNKLKKREKRYQ